MPSGELATAGVAGPFPWRFPVGLMASVLTAILLAPAFWWIGMVPAPTLQKFYAATYYRTMLDSLKSGNGAAQNLPKWFQRGPAKPDVKPYRVLLTGGNLAVQKTIDACPGCVTEKTVGLNPARFHEWLKAYIYFGSPAGRLYMLPITLAVLGGMVIVMAGAQFDRKRRAAARKGVFLRGTRMVSWKKFNQEALGQKLIPGLKWERWHPKFYRRYRRTPGIRFPIGKHGEHLIIPKELESYHLNILGTTGMGKSTLLRDLVYQIQARGDVMVVYDPKGEFRDEFYKEGDFIVDPTDERCVYWALEEEAQDEARATPWGMAFWPDEPGQQPFFKKHPRAIFSYLISRFSIYNEPENPATCANLGAWFANPRLEIAARLDGTKYAIGVDEAAKDQSQGLYTTLSEVAKPLEMMPASPEGRQHFSVRDWSDKRPGNIFLTSTPLTVGALLPLQSAMMDMLILSNQQPREENDERPHVWFLLDEVPTLQNLPQLESGTTKQRASGNPIVLGLHDVPQMVKRYGEQGAKTIMGQAFTNIVFRMGGDGTAARQMETLIGHAEIDRVQENRPNDILSRSNRSSSMSSQTVDVPVVSAAEIQKLPPFHGYFVQEGMVVPFETQPIPRRKVTSRIERMIPQVVFRRAPGFDTDDKTESEEAGAGLDEAASGNFPTARASHSRQGKPELPTADRYLAKMRRVAEKLAAETIKRGWKPEDFEGPPQTKFICARCRSLIAFEGVCEEPPEERCQACGGNFYQINGEYVRNTIMQPHLRKQARKGRNPLLGKKQKEPAATPLLPGLEETNDFR